ncbi:response regulator [Bradyrhizobium sp. 35]|nr:response regulator [Bradyrhizobium sp. 35]
MLPLEFTDLGHQRVKNIDEAVRAYDVTSNGAATLHTSSCASASGPNGSFSAQELHGVVVIDDDPGTRDSLRRLLSQWGYKCFTFDAGEPAVNFLRKEGQRKPWLILLDYLFAGAETGFTIADKITSLWTGKTRISLMTGDTGDEIADGAKQRGLILIRKPIQPIRLNALLSSS